MFNAKVDMVVLRIIVVNSLRLMGSAAREASRWKAMIHASGIFPDYGFLTGVAKGITALA